jgi:DNA-binding response OmpR family regulator
VPQAVDSGVSDRQTTASAAATVLVIEDEPGILDFVRRGLEGEGFGVRTATDGIEGERMALTEDIDALVLDLMLPGRGGFEIIAALRQARPALPVIVLSALGELDDRLAGLEAGAVDYLVKPFPLPELIARVRAQLRAVELASASTLRAGDIEVNLLTRRASRGGETVRLSSTEFELLTYLMRHHGEVLSRARILSAVWGYEHDPATNIVDVYIGYLRRKLRQPDRPAPIHTVRSVGYRFGSATR